MDLRRRAPRILLSLVPVFLVTSCGSGTGESADGAPRWEAAIDTVGDTIVVRTVSGQVWETDRTLVSEVSIGVLDGAAEYQFGGIRVFAVDREGRIYVFDSHVPALRVYGPDGTWLRDIGREGEGPGEYKQPDSGLAILPDGRIALRDPGNGRINLYSPEGEYLDYFRIAGSFNTSSPMIAETSGTVATFIVTNLGTSVFEWQQGLARYHADGTVDTVLTPDLGYEPAKISGEKEGSSSINQVPFSPQQVEAYSPEGYFLVGVNEDYSFDVLRPGGVLRIARSYESVPVDPDEAAAARETQTENFRRNFPGWKWNGPSIPDHKPAYWQFQVADDGRIWVRVPAPSVRYLDAVAQKAEEERLGRSIVPFREPVRYDVFGASGEYLGRVSAPDGFQAQWPPPVFRGDTVWAIMRDEFDVQRLHRFHLEPVQAD